MDSFENILNGYNVEDLEMPLTYTKTIKKALYTKKRNLRTRIYPIIANVIAFLIVSTITVYAFSQIINLQIVGTNTNGINKTLNNGYLQKIDMDSIIQNRTKCKIEYLLLDDTDLDLIFNINFEDDISEYQGFNIPDLLITDENNTQIFLDTEEKEHEKSAATSMGWKVLEKDAHNIRQLLFLKSFNFPKSKTLYLKFDKVVLYNVNNGKPFTKIIDGDWKIEIKVQTDFVKRNPIKYKVQSFTNEEIKIIEAKLINTGFIIKFKSNLDFRNNKNLTIKVYDSNNKEYKFIDSDIISNNEYTVSYDMTKYDNQTDLFVKVIENDDIISEIKLSK